jgi:hypothetical protein
MAYIVTTETTLSDGAINNVDISMPAGHQAGDMTVLMITQDGGGSNILNPGGEFTIIGSQAAAQAQRTIAYFRIHAGSGEADVNFTGAADEWIITAVLIRGATTLSIDQNNQTNSANSTSNSLASGTVTTSVDNCLILSCFGFDGVFKLALDNTSLNKSVNLSKEINIGCVQICQYFNKLSAGVTDVLTALSEVQSEGGSALTIAIREATPSTALMSPMITQAYNVLKYYGGVTSASTSTAAFIRHDGVTWVDVNGNITPTSLDGIGIIATPTFAEAAAQGTLSTWGSMTGLSFTGSAIDNTGRWMGRAHTISSTSFIGKIFTVEFQVSVVATTSFGEKGVAVYFEDNSGSWKAFTMSRRQRLVAGLSYVYFVDVENATALGSGGTINWANIVKVAYLSHKRTTATTANILRVKNALLLDKVIMVDGCAQAPCSPAFLEKILGGLDPIYGGHGAYILNTVQGKGQSLARFGVQYGDGSRKTYYDASATSLELPLRADSSLAKRFWRVEDVCGGAQVRIKSSATDVVKQNACVIATDTEQLYIIDPASNAGASYDFAGSSVIGWRLTHNVAGISINDATLQNCRITLNGGTLNGCTINNSKDRLVTDNPQNIIDCAFISPGAGHAIEITDPGTYNFNGNTFSGYGADASTDAMIYNNSGGLVTLILPAGAQTLTVRDGAGASTVIEAPTVDISVPAALENSRIQIYNVTIDEEIDNDVVGDSGYDYTITTEASNGDTIRLRLTLLGKEPIEGVGVFNSSTGLSFLVDQQDDPIYDAIGINGSTVTEFAPNYTDDYVEVDAATTTKARFAAWWFHNLTTEDGIRKWYGGLFLEDEANYRVVTTRVDLQFDNVNSPPTRFTDNTRRLYRDDLGNIIADTSGSIQMDSGKVYTSVVSTSGDPVITGDISELNDLSAAEVRAAIGMGSANLDTQLATIQADLDNPNQYKADVSGLATSAELAAVLGALETDIGNIPSAGDVAAAVWAAAVRTLSAGGEFTETEKTQLIKIYQALMLDPTAPVTTTPDQISFADVVIALTGDPETSIVGTRQP